MQVVKSRREQYADATRTALLESATRLFGERGFTGTALEDVASDARVTRGAVYHHFGNKRALFEAVFDELEARVITDVQQVADGSDAEPAMAAIDTYLDHCCDPVYGRIVWQEGPIALGWNRWEESEQRYAYGLIERFLRLAVEEGRIAPVPVETTTRLVCSLLGAAGMALAATPDKGRVRTECSDVIRRMLQGLGSPEPSRET